VCVCVCVCVCVYYFMGYDGLSWIPGEAGLV